jgi:hypothetical protein
MLKIEVRNSQSSDVDAVLDYLDANRHPIHIGRHRDVIAEQVEGRSFVLVHSHRERLGSERTLSGVAGIFPYPRNPNLDRDSGAEPPWRELGSARVTLNGFGLHKLLIAARVAHDLVLSPGAEAQFAVLRDHDIRSTETHITAGFAPWSPPSTLATLWAGACNVTAPMQGDSPAGYQFLALPRVAAAQLIHYLLRCDVPDFMLIRPASRRHGAAEAAQLSLMLDCLRSHRQELTLLSEVDAVHGRLRSVQALGDVGQGF